MPSRHRSLLLHAITWLIRHPSPFTAIRRHMRRKCAMQCRWSVRVHNVLGWHCRCAPRSKEVTRGHEASLNHQTGGLTASIHAVIEISMVVACLGVLLSVERDQGKGSLADHTRNLHDHDALADCRRPTGPSPLSCTVYLDRMVAPRTERTRTARQAQARSGAACRRADGTSSKAFFKSGTQAGAANVLKCTAGPTPTPATRRRRVTRVTRTRYRFPQPEKLLESFSGSTREPRPAHPTIRIGPSRAVKRRDARHDSPRSTPPAPRLTATRHVRVPPHDSSHDSALTTPACTWTS